jgi:UDP-N-acetylglucosamine/UDP-N-acetylgalactosamine diphosphorylase
MNLDILKNRGVKINNAASVSIDTDVCLDNIADNVVIYGGCRITGSKTSIGPGTVLGREGFVTLENCQLGANVKLGSGYFSGVTFLDGVQVGAGAHIRPGTLLEEHSSCAHTVGLKQTILMPFVTLGSLINFCDILMAGGTSSANHGEVGSSYIHFNYTPHQDKATASLLGNVPFGVMLDQSPVFLGGQGGLVGPSTLAFGTIIGAGTVFSGNVEKENQLISGGKRRDMKPRDYNPAIYGNVDRVIDNNFLYIGNLFALREWYQHVRILFMTANRFSKACYDGAIEQINAGIKERIKRLDGLAVNLQKSIDAAEDTGLDIASVRFVGQSKFIDEWPQIKHNLELFKVNDAATDKRDKFVAQISKSVGNQLFIEAVQSLRDDVKQLGTSWLREIVEAVLVK